MLHSSKPVNCVMPAACKRASRLGLGVAGNGEAKLLPPSRVSLVTQPTMNTGPVVSETVTVWLQMFELPQQSVADHVRVIAVLHFCKLLVNVFRTLMVTLLPQQASNADGGSKPHWLPHSTVLSCAQLICGG